MKDIMTKSEYVLIRAKLQKLEHGDNKARAKARRLESILRQYEGVLCYFNNGNRHVVTAGYILPFPFMK